IRDQYINVIRGMLNSAILFKLAEMMEAALETVIGEFRKFLYDILNQTSAFPQLPPLELSQETKGGLLEIINTARDPSPSSPSDGILAIQLSYTFATIHQMSP